MPTADETETPFVSTVVKGLRGSMFKVKQQEQNKIAIEFNGVFNSEAFIRAVDQLESLCAKQAKIDVLLTVAWIANEIRIHIKD